jgi:hypothetical protein
MPKIYRNPGTFKKMSEPGFTGLKDDQDERMDNFFCLSALIMCENLVFLQGFPRY